MYVFFFSFSVHFDESPKIQAMLKSKAEKTTREEEKLLICNKIVRKRRDFGSISTATRAKDYYNSVSWQD